MTHYDGSDVWVMLDSSGCWLPAVEEVRVECDRAVVALKDDRELRQTLRGLAREAPAVCSIHSSRDGRLHWNGPVRLVYV